MHYFYGLFETLQATIFWMIAIFTNLTRKYIYFTFKLQKNKLENVLYLELSSFFPHHTFSHITLFPNTLQENNRNKTKILQ